MRDRLAIPSFIVLFVAVLLTFFVHIPQPVYGGFGGGGIFAYLPQAGTVASSSALNAAIGTDTILNVTEAGQLQSLIVEVATADVTGTPAVDLLLTIDGNLRTIPLYVAGTSFPQWIQNLSATQPSGSGQTFSPVNLATVVGVDLTTVGSTPILTVTNPLKIHSIQVTVSVNVTSAALDEIVYLRFTQGGISQDFELYNTATVFVENGNPTFGSTFFVNGTGALVGDDVILTPQTDYSDLVISVVRTGTNLFLTGELDTFVFYSNDLGSGSGVSGSTSGNKFRWDVSAVYLQSLLVQIDRTVVATSPTTLRLTTLRNTRL